MWGKKSTRLVATLNFISLGFALIFSLEKHHSKPFDLTKKHVEPQGFRCIHQNQTWFSPKTKQKTAHSCEYKGPKPPKSTGNPPRNKALRRDSFIGTHLGSIFHSFSGGLAFFRRVFFGGYLGGRLWLP